MPPSPRFGNIANRQRPAQLMSQTMRIRKAHVREAGFLSKLAVRSKAYWGYSQEFLDACRSELRVDAARLEDENFECFVAVDDGSIHGFYATERVSACTYELEALFVEPESIGRGVGQLLVEHAVQMAAGRDIKRLVIQGDPNATGFYARIGARQIGTRESDSIPGRHLPLFEIDIEGWQSQG